MGDRSPRVTIEVQSIHPMNLGLYSHYNCPNMKPPKLPGTEKFMFSDNKYIECRKGSMASDRMDRIDSAIESSNFIRGIPARSTCPTAPVSGLSTQSQFHRSDSRRKPILPISSRMTSRVLTLTHLPLDSFDIRDLNSTTTSQHKYTNGQNVGESRPTANTTSTSRVSLFSDCSGSHCSSSQPSPRSLCSPLDRSLTPSQWAKNAHRLSTSSQSSWEDCPEIHESFWISRKN